MLVRILRRSLFLCFFALLASTFIAAQSAPTITEVLPAAKAHGGDTVTIRGTNFGATQGSGILKIRGTSSITINSWSDTEIVAIAPNYIASTATWGIQVTQNGVAGNQFPYEIVRPEIISISPSSAWAGSSVTVTGTNLRATQKPGDWVMIGGQLITVSSWSDIQVTISPWATPTGATQAFVSDYSPAFTGFTLLVPQVTSVSPTSGRALDTITITGTDFGTSTETAYREVRIANRVVTPTSWTNTEIIAPAPYYYSTSTPEWGVLVRQGAYSNIAPFTLFRPSITNITPSAAFPGTNITITGTGFGPSHDPDVILWVAGYPAQTTYWSDTQIIATVPSYPSYAPPTTTTSMYVREYSAGYVGFTATLPQLTEVSPAIASAGTQVVLSGTNFGSSPGTVKLGGLFAAVTNWEDTQVVAVVPAGVTTTTTAVVRQGQDSNAVSFNIVGPSITNQPGPASAPGQGAPVIQGARFGATQGSSTVTFNGVAATSCPNWNDTWVACVVPAGATSGPIVVTVSGIPSNAVNYTVAPHAQIFNIDPPAALAGASITINGISFYDQARSVYFPGAGWVSTFSAWSDTSVTVNVPSGTTSGGVIVRSWWRGDSQPFQFDIGPVNPQLSAVNPGSGGLGSSVTLSGQHFGSSGTVSIHGANAQVISWGPNAIEAVIPDGLNPGLGYIQVAGQYGPTNTVTFEVTNPLLVNPSEVALLVGEQQGFQVLNSSGTEQTGVTWTVVDSEKAELDPTDPTSINALALGETKVRAHLGNQTGFATVKVVGTAGYQFPAGTVRLSSPPLNSGYVTNVVQSHKVDEDSPAFFVQEQQGGVQKLRGFMEDGRQKWAYPGSAQMIAPDNAGGVLAMIPATPTDPPYLHSIGKAGNMQWQITGSGLGSSRWAVHPNNTLFLVRTTNPSASVNQAELVGVDSVTGQQLVSLLLTGNTHTRTGIGSYYHEQQNRTYPTCDPSATSTTYTAPRMGQFIVTSDGSVFLPTAITNLTQTAVCTPATYEDASGIHPVEFFSSYSEYSWNARIEVHKFDAENNPQTPSSSSRPRVAARAPIRSSAASPCAISPSPTAPEGSSSPAATTTPPTGSIAPAAARLLHPSPRTRCYWVRTQPSTSPATSSSAAAMRPCRWTPAPSSGRKRVG